LIDKNCCENCFTQIKIKFCKDSVARVQLDMKTFKLTGKLILIYGMGSPPTQRPLIKLRFGWENTESLYQQP